jgi:peptide/nickel transport system substrate-binding protein
MCLAEKMERNEDATTLTITLKDAKWHDGKPVTAKDVVMSVSLMILRKGASKGMNLKGYEAFTKGEAETLAGIVEKDEKTVVFEFDSPNYLFHEEIANNNYVILPYHVLGGKSLDEIDKSDYWLKPIGTGPYMINEVNYPNYITLTRFDDYHTGKAGIKDILVNIYADTTAENNAMMAGELHFLDDMTEADAKSITGANSRAKMLVKESSYTRLIQFNLSDKEGARKDLKNQKIRQALSMIIDRQAVVDYIGAQASLATTFNVSDYNQDVPKWQRNLEEGKKILQQEGFDFSTPMRLFTSYTDQQSADILDIVVASLKEAGIECKVTVDKTNAQSVMYEKCDFDLAYIGANAGGGTGGYGMMSSTKVYKAWYTKAELAIIANTYEKPVDQYSSTPDEEGRTAIVDQLQVQYVEDCYQLPIWHRGSIWVMDERFTGFDSVPSDFRATAKVDTTKWALAD